MFLSKQKEHLPLAVVGLLSSPGQPGGDWDMYTHMTGRCLGSEDPQSADLALGHQQFTAPRLDTQRSHQRAVPEKRA